MKGSYFGIERVLSTSSALMSNIFSSAPTPSSLPFAPEGSLLLSAPPKEAHPQSLGTTITNSIHQYPSHGPSHLQYGTKDTHTPLPQHGFTPQQSDPVPQYSSDTPPFAMVSADRVSNHPAEHFHPYNPVQKPEARINRGTQKQVTPAESPEAKSASNGRRRTRTKVVAWDPRDLEDIYVRKEINKEDWDTICKVSLLSSCLLSQRTNT